MWAIVGGAGDQSANACSCGVEAGSFLVADGAVLPRNAVGIPWAGHRLGEAADSDDRCDAPWRTRRLTLERLEGNRSSRLGFDVREVAGAEIPGWRARDLPLYLLVPRGGVVAGARYRVTERWTASDYGPNGADAPRTVAKQQTVEVSISGDRLDPSAELATVVAREPQRGTPWVENVQASCSTKFEAGYRDVEMRLPPTLERWSGSLLVSTFVDAAVWRPTQSLCSLGVAGTSWTKPGAERLFLECGPRCEDCLDPNPPPLDAGTHAVRMVAWLPGTPIRFEGSASVELGCGVPN